MGVVMGAKMVPEVWRSFRRETGGIFVSRRGVVAVPLSMAERQMSA